jgi:hypothetical protein
MRMDNLDDEIVIHGFPMTTPAILLAAMVIRLGGRVELTQTELLTAQGLMLTPGTSGIVLEANTDPIHGVLNADTLDDADDGPHPKNS